LPDAVAEGAGKKITPLASEPRPSGVKKLKGKPERGRLRIGDWRVIYSIDIESST
jgi:mRNA interferase RelE/StbE